MVKVSVVEPVGGHGGMNYYDFGLADGLAEAGADVALYTCDKTQAPVPARFVFKRPFRGIYGKANKYVRGVRYLGGLLGALFDSVLRGAAVCHFHFFHFTGVEYISVFLARLVGLSVVVTVHDVESFSGDSTSEQAAKTLGLASKIIVHNNVSAAEVVSKVGVPPEKIAIIPHGNYLPYVDDSVTRGDARSQLSIDVDRKVILFFGQIKEVKGLDLLLSSLRTVVDQDHSVQLVIAGKVWKDDFSKYAGIIARNELDMNVRLDVRYIPDAEAPLYYKAADVVVLPYRRIYQSGVLLMAMSYGRAVVVSDLPGMTEVVTNGETGFVFRSEDEKSLADTLITALVDDRARDNVAAKGLQLMKDKYDWACIGARTHGVYREVARG